MLLNVGNRKTKWGDNGVILKLWTFCQSEFSVIIQTSGELIYLILESVCFLLNFSQENHFSSSVPAVLCHCIYTMDKFNDIFFCSRVGGDPLQKEQYGRSFISEQAQVITKPVQNPGISLSELTCHRQTKINLQNPEIFSDLLRFLEV